MWCKDSGKNLSRYTKFEDVQKVVDFLNAIGRSNIKGLAAAAKKGDLELEMELNRIFSHMSDSEKAENAELWQQIKKMDKNLKRKIFYDTVIAYDLWFDDILNSSRE